jgi:hypothetical protein
MEWMKIKPDVTLKHPKLQEGVEVSHAKFYPKGIEATYYSAYGDGPPMNPYFGNQMPYINKGKIQFTALVFHSFYGCGATMVISEELANDRNWEEVK